MHYLRKPNILYNEFDPGAAAWLRELIQAGLIAAGEVDERSILDVCADDLRGFTQCHFFAGIGGWSYALRLAGWPDDRPVWTGSPPCQPFSAAGRQEGRKDARHLAPHFINLVGAARPAVLFGEQVASAEVFGKAAGGAGKRAGGPPAWAWIDDLSDRLEAARYAVGASDFPSAGVGAPHIRQRTFFGAVSLADADDAGLEGRREPGRERGTERPAGARGVACGLADCPSLGRIRRGASETGTEPGAQQRLAGLRDVGGVANTDGWNPGAERQQRGGEQRQQPEDDGTGELGAAGPWKSYADWFGCCWHDDCRNSDRGFCDCNTRGAPNGWYWDIHDGWVGNPGIAASERNAGKLPAPEAREYGAGFAADGHLPVGPEHAGAGLGGGQSSPLHGFWSDADWLFCRDGKWRPVEPGTQPLAHGVSGRVGLLRGYGNAINPWAAKEFIQAFDASVRHLWLTETSEMTTGTEDIFG